MHNEITTNEAIAAIEEAVINVAAVATTRGSVKLDLELWHHRGSFVERYHVRTRIGNKETEAVFDDLNDALTSYSAFVALL